MSQLGVTSLFTKKMSTEGCLSAVESIRMVSSFRCFHVWH